MSKIYYSTSIRDQIMQLCRSNLKIWRYRHNIITDFLDISSSSFDRR
jgi:hypothetical protein